jgi:hypothetical protein
VGEKLCSGQEGKNQNMSLKKRLLRISERRGKKAGHGREASHMSEFHSKKAFV